jgi:hypothetical protein
MIDQQRGVGVLATADHAGAGDAEARMIAAGAMNIWERDNRAPAVTVR